MVGKIYTQVPSPSVYYSNVVWMYNTDFGCIYIIGTTILTVSIKCKFKCCLKN